jgi:hypothetical protein
LVRGVVSKNFVHEGGTYRDRKQTNGQPRIE